MAKNMNRASEGACGQSLGSAIVVVGGVSACWLSDRWSDDVTTSGKLHMGC